MPNPYPIQVENTSGVVTTEGAATFTDPGNQPGGGSQTFAQARVLISAAEVLAIYTTPKVVVASPGAKAIIVPMFYSVEVVPVTTPYTDHGGGLVLSDSSQSQQWMSFPSSGFWDQAAPYDSQLAVLGFYGIPGTVSGFLAIPASIAGNDLVFYNDTANPTAGDGSLVVTVGYVVVTVA